MYSVDRNGALESKPSDKHGSALLQVLSRPLSPVSLFLGLCCVLFATVLLFSQLLGCSLLDLVRIAIDAPGM